MRADGLISWRANHVIVHDRAALAGAAGFQAEYLKLNGIVWFATGGDLLVEQEEIWQRAAECSRLLDMLTDETNRKLIANLRDLWIALGNESPFLGKAKLIRQIAELEKIQLEVIRL
jgi:hypothetical protein